MNAKQNGKKKYLTQAEFARKHGVSRERVRTWVEAGRIPFYEPAEGVVLIPANTPRPKPLKGGRPKTKKNGRRKRT